MKEDKEEARVNVLEPLGVVANNADVQLIADKLNEVIAFLNKTNFVVEKLVEKPGKNK